MEENEQELKTTITAGEELYLNEMLPWRPDHVSFERYMNNIPTVTEYPI